MTVGEKSVNPLRDEASLKRSGNQKKKTHFVGLFFSLRLRRPPSQLDRPCAMPDVPLTTGSTLRLSTYGQHAWSGLSIYLWGESWVNPLPDEASSTKWEFEPEKKDPLRGSVFSYRPSAGAAPRSVLTHQNCGFKLKFQSSNCKFKRNKIEKLKFLKQQSSKCSV